MQRTRYETSTYRSELLLAPVLVLDSEEGVTAEPWCPCTIQLPITCRPPAGAVQPDSDTSANFNRHGDQSDLISPELYTAPHTNSLHLETDGGVDETGESEETSADETGEDKSNQRSAINANATGDDEFKQPDAEQVYEVIETDTDCEKMDDRHLDWVTNNNNEGDESDEEPRLSYPSRFMRRDSTDLLIEEAKQACLLQYMQAFQVAKPASANSSDTSSECSDTYSDESRSTCSTFDISEQTEDSEPRLVIPKLYDRLDSPELKTEANERKPEVVNKVFERVPSFIQGYSNDGLQLSAK